MNCKDVIDFILVVFIFQVVYDSFKNLGRDRKPLWPADRSLYLHVQNICAVSAVEFFNFC